MSRLRLLAVVGSLGTKSGNLALLERAAQIAPSEIEIEIFGRLGELPFFDPDIDPEHAPPPVLELRRAIARSDALLVACPEYGHSLPGVLKNAIDWLIGSGELERKVVAITASVPAPERGLRGLAALRQTLGAVSAVVPFDAPIARGPDADREIGIALAAIARAVRERPID
jgi:chromate reductase, NAD(P)H dehydrogenase (quinone)